MLATISGTPAVLILYLIADGSCFTNHMETWTGRYFPGDVKEVKSNRVDMYDVNPLCDDGKTNLTVDWDNSPLNYTCFSYRIQPDWNIQPIIHYDNIPKAYHAYHECMSEEIHYKQDIPTFGTHRPQWGKYGEYVFIPKQRWLHNLEHGAVVMLYHPCAHPTLVGELRSIVTSCLYRHVITPSTSVPEDRPLMLLTWGTYLAMNTVNEKLIVRYIKENALNGLENISRDGKYDFMLETAAKRVSEGDRDLCPGYAG